MGRAWSEVRDLKVRAWATHARVGGPMAGLDVSAQLWNHARSIDPNWPYDAVRASDLEHHAQLCAVLDRLRDVEPGQ